jgi:hypothetical protein
MEWRDTEPTRERGGMTKLERLEEARAQAYERLYNPGAHLKSTRAEINIFTLEILEEKIDILLERLNDIRS